MLGDIVTVRWPDADGVWKTEVEKRLAAVSQQLEVRKDGQSADGLSAADPVTLTIIAAAIPATATILQSIILAVVQVRIAELGGSAAPHSANSGAHASSAAPHAEQAGEAKVAKTINLVLTGVKGASKIEVAADGQVPIEKLAEATSKIGPVQGIAVE